MQVHIVCATGVGVVRVDRVPFGGAGRDPAPAASLRSRTTVVNKLEEYHQKVSQFLTMSSRATD